MEMRGVLLEELKKIMSENEKIVIINADLAKCAGLSDLYRIFPERCFNVGVAEQNMAGIAAGMSAYGFIPLIFTFAPFATRRICDQIAVSICYAKQNVKIFGLDPGITAETNGGTHMSFEDIACMRSFPGLVIFDPCDEYEFRSSISQIINHEGSVYTRMFRKQAPSIYNENYNFKLMKSDIIKKGEDVSIFSSGIILKEALEAAIDLELDGISAEVINFHTIKPIDTSAIINSAKKTKKVITVENHSIIGGLFSAVSEVLSENFPVIVKPLGIRDKFGQVGKMQFLKEEYGITKSDIINCVISILKHDKQKMFGGIKNKK